jgi:hypothetical protein
MASCTRALSPTVELDSTCMNAGQLCMTLQALARMEQHWGWVGEIGIGVRPALSTAATRVSVSMDAGQVSRTL